MTQTEPDQKNRSSAALIFQRHFEITYRVIFLTIAPLGILGGIGYLLDKHFGTFPWLLSAGIFTAFPLAQVMVYKTFTSLTKKNDGRTSS